MFFNRRVFLTTVFMLFITSYSLFAADKIKIEEGKYYINKAMSEKKAGGVLSGPYETLEDAVAGWIATNQKEDSFFCITSDKQIIATKPSKQIPEIYEPIFDEFLENPEAACKKYGVELNKGAIKKLENTRAKITKKTGQEFPDAVIAAAAESTVNEIAEVPAEQESNEPEEEIQTQPEPESSVIVLSAAELELEPEESVENAEEEEVVVATVTEHDEKQLEEQRAEAERIAAEEAARIEAEKLEAEKLEAERLEAERIAAEKEAAEKARQEEAIRKALENVNKTTVVSRYQKEYLQDYMKDDLAELPDDYQTAETPLIENPDQKDSNGQTLLMKAAKAGNEWQLQLLIKSGADLNIKDKDGWTALMYAVRYQESLGAVNLLIAANADIKAKNNYDSSALLLAACYNNNPEILRKLLNYYSTSEKDVLKAFTQLLSATLITEYIQMAKINIFLEKSIQLNTFYEGKTPLMYAAQYGNSTNVIKLLLDNGCITTVRSTEGKTAFEYATKNAKLKHDDNYWALNLK